MPSTDSGERIYAIGDIHGRYDLLQLLLDQIGEHARALPPARSFYIVFVGDLVDRGPQSAEVLAMLYDLQLKSKHVMVLLGNHEEAMLQALQGDPQMFRRWLAVGGVETLRSFGVGPMEEDENVRDYILRARAAVPRPWLSWLSRLPLSVQSGDYYFVHAGVRPGVALNRQNRDDMLWIREDFLEDTRNHGAVIVHGHSIAADVEIRKNRIGIDTGAYESGVLSAIYLEGQEQQVIAARMPVAQDFESGRTGRL